MQKIIYMYARIFLVLTAIILNSASCLDALIIPFAAHVYGLTSLGFNSFAYTLKHEQRIQTKWHFVNEIETKVYSRR